MPHNQPMLHQTSAKNLVRGVNPVLSHKNKTEPNQKDDYPIHENWIPTFPSIHSTKSSLIEQRVFWQDFDQQR